MATMEEVNAAIEAAVNECHRQVTAEREVSNTQIRTDFQAMGDTCHNRLQTSFAAQIAKLESQAQGMRVTEDAASRADDLKERPDHDGFDERQGHADGRSREDQGDDEDTREDFSGRGPREAQGDVGHD